jgi:hypothetical protein
MSQKEKHAKQPGDNSKGLWLAPGFKLKAAPSKLVGWQSRPSDPGPSRFVELADKALEIWERGPNRKKTRKSA